MFYSGNTIHLLSALCIQKIEFAAYFGCTAKSAQFEASCVEIEVYSIPAMIVLWQYFLTYELEKMFISLQLQGCCSPAFMLDTIGCVPCKSIATFCIHKNGSPRDATPNFFVVTGDYLASLLTPPPTMLI